MGTGYLSRG